MPWRAETRDASADAEQRALHRLLEVHAAQLGANHAGGQPRRVEQVADQRGELVDRLLDGGQQFGGVLGGEVDVVAAQAGHRGLGGGQRCAQVVADRRQQRAAQFVGLRDRLGLAGLLGELALLDQARRLLGDRGRAPGGPARRACGRPSASRTRRRRPRSRCRRNRRRRTGPGRRRRRSRHRSRRPDAQHAHGALGIRLPHPFQQRLEVGAAQHRTGEQRQQLGLLRCLPWPRGPA